MIIADKNFENFGCQDWAQMTAVTTVAKIDTANAALSGAGAISVLTATGNNGAYLRSVTIKSQSTNSIGMVRLFVGPSAAGSSLIREIPIPVNPVLTSTPTPTPVLPTLETYVELNLKLAPGQSLFATTLNSEPFTIIAESLSWTYPNPTPPVCCSFKQEFASTGVGKISVANPNITGSIGAGLVTIFTAPAAGTPSNGTRVRSITVSALQSTSEGMVRLFISPNGGVDFFLWFELFIPLTTQSSFQPSYKQMLDIDLFLQPGYVIGATTQKANTFAITIEGVSWKY